MKKNESITKIMTKDPIAVSSVSPLREVAAIFLEQPIHHVPIVENKKLVGLVSFSDLMRLSFADAFNQDGKEVMRYLDETNKITDVMIKDVKTISSTGTVKDAAELLCRGDLHAACVVDNNGNLEGIVTSTDVIKYLLEQY